MHENNRSGVPPFKTTRANAARGRRCGLAAALVFVTALAAAQGAGTPGYSGKSAWELEQERREWKEEPVVLPPYYREEDLLPFEAVDARQFRFFVDRRSISVVGERVVRYTVVGRSREGVENVFFEGIRCDARMARLYAIGQPGGAWKKLESDWRETEQAWTRALRREYFCPRREAIRNAAEGVDALRRGGHVTGTAPP